MVHVQYGTVSSICNPIEFLMHFRLLYRFRFHQYPIIPVVLLGTLEHLLETQALEESKMYSGTGMVQ